MNRMKTLALSVTLALTASCTSTKQLAQVSNFDTGSTPNTYPTKITGRLEATASAVSISPGYVKLFGGDTSATIAYNDAVGKILWNRDDTDALVGTKCKVETTNFLGIFETSRAHIKGVGVGIETGK
jgi:hypothetical protein